MIAISKLLKLRILLLSPFVITYRFIASRSVDLFQKNEFSPSRYVSSYLNYGKIYRQRSPKVRVPTTFCDDDEDFDDITMHVPKFQF